jgi:hypothetical protein
MTHTRKTFGRRASTFRVTERDWSADRLPVINGPEINESTWYQPNNAEARYLARRVIANARNGGRNV